MLFQANFCGQPLSSVLCGESPHTSESTDPLAQLSRAHTCCDVSFRSLAQIADFWAPQDCQNPSLQTTTLDPLQMDMKFERIVEKPQVRPWHRWLRTPHRLGSSSAQMEPSQSSRPSSLNLVLRRSARKSSTDARSLPEAEEPVNDGEPTKCLVHCQLQERPGSRTCKYIFPPIFCKRTSYVLPHFLNTSARSCLPACVTPHHNADEA